MKVEYRKLFLKDLKKLKKQPVYQCIYHLVFTVLPEAQSLQELSDVKALTGKNQYRIRVGDYRVGLELNEDTLGLCGFSIVESSIVIFHKLLTMKS